MSKASKGDPGFRALSKDEVERIKVTRFYPKINKTKTKSFNIKNPIKADGKVVCLCCGKPMRPVEKKEKYMSPCTKCGVHHKVGADQIMIHDGLVQKIHAGYGSDYDTMTFMFALCDDCISNALKTKRLLFDHFYL